MLLQQDEAKTKAQVLRRNGAGQSPVSMAQPGDPLMLAVLAETASGQGPISEEVQQAAQAYLEGAGFGAERWPALVAARPSLEAVRAARRDFDAEVDGVPPRFDSLQSLDGMTLVCWMCRQVCSHSDHWHGMEPRLLDYLFGKQELGFSQGLCPTCVTGYFEAIPQPSLD